MTAVPAIPIALTSMPITIATPLSAAVAVANLFPSMMVITSVHHGNHPPDERYRIRTSYADADAFLVRPLLLVRKRIKMNYKNKYKNNEQ